MTAKNRLIHKQLDVMSMTANKAYPLNKADSDSTKHNSNTASGDIPFTRYITSCLGPGVAEKSAR